MNRHAAEGRQDDREQTHGKHPLTTQGSRDHPMQPRRITSSRSFDGTDQQSRRSEREIEAGRENLQRSQQQHAGQCGIPCQPGVTPLASRASYSIDRQHEKSPQTGCAGTRHERVENRACDARGQRQPDQSGMSGNPAQQSPCSCGPRKSQTDMQAGYRHEVSRSRSPERTPLIIVDSGSHAVEYGRSISSHRVLS